MKLSNIKKRLSTFFVKNNDGLDNNTDNNIDNNNNSIDNNSNSGNIARSSELYKRKKDELNNINNNQYDSDNEDEDQDEDIGYNKANKKSNGEDDVNRKVTFQDNQPSKKLHIDNSEILSKFKKRKSILLPTSAIGSIPPNPITSNGQIINATSIRSQLDHKRISELYQSAIKMSTENKINQKNSWDMQLIDYIKDVVDIQEQSDSGTTNFQAASCALDASIKIYSCRVDSVHVNTIKVLGGLSRAGAKDYNQDDNDNENGDKDGNANKDDKAKKRRKKGIHTLEENLDNITVKKLESKCAVDPLFSKTTAAFDEGGAKGLLLNNLSIYGNCKIVFDSNDAIYENEEEIKKEREKEKERSKQNQESKFIELDQWKHLFSPDHFKELEICPTYYGFSDWLDDAQTLDISLNFDSNSNVNNNIDNDNNNNNNNNNNNGLDNDNQKQQDNNNVNNNNSNNNFGGDDDYYDFGGGAGPEWDDNDFEDQNNLPGAQDNNNNNNNNSTNFSNDISLFERNDNQNWDNNLFGNQNEEDDGSNWAGPEHWKFKKVTRKSKQHQTEQEEDQDKPQTTKKRKARRKQAPLSFDFNTPLADSWKFETANTSQSATTLRRNAVSQQNNNNNLLPPDIHFSLNKLARLFTKPQFYVPTLRERYQFTKRTKRDINDPISSQALGGIDQYQKDEEDIESSNPFTNNNDDDYDYGGAGGGPDWDDNDLPTNNNDNSNLDQSIQLDNNDDNNLDQLINDNINNSTIKTNFIGLNNGVLVQQPRKVNRIQINYARVSKKIDVKQLKTSVWNILKKKYNKDNDSENEQSEDEKEQQQQQQPLNDDGSFGSLMENLYIEQNQLKAQNKPTAGDISVPLAFICVLHLANEKNLSLDQKDIDNFFISK